MARKLAAKKLHRREYSVAGLSTANRSHVTQRSAGSRRRKNLARWIKENSNKDGIDRRGFLECMAWAGTGMIWTVSGGVLGSKAFGQTPGHQMGGGAGFSFVQISDSHIGFNKEANKDVTATLQEAISKINGLEQ